MDPRFGRDLPHHAAGLMLRLRALFRRRRLDRDLDDEMQFHLAMREEKLRSEGMAAAEAHAAARRRFGSPTSIRERCRALWTFEWIESCWQDVRFGARQLRHSPAFTVVSALTLALGVGGTVALYTLFDTILWRPMADPHLQRLVVVAQRLPGPSRVTFFDAASVADLEDIRASAASFEGLGIYRNTETDLMDPDGQPFRVESATVAPGFFAAVHAKPAIGRTFGPGEERVAVLSDDLWRARFQADRRIIGTTVRVDGANCTVIGVMPPGFTLPRVNRKLWLPLPAAGADRTTRTAMAMGHLKPNVTMQQAAAELEAIGKRLASIYPDTNRERRFHSWTYQYFMIGPLVPIYEALLLGAAGFVLLIACANVASLQFARATARWREIALRTALGAPRGRIVRQLAMESVLVAALGAAVGIVAAHWALLATKASIPSYMREFLPGWDHIGLNLSALAFALGCALASGLIIGLAPAWRSSRPNLTEALKEGGHGGGGSRTRARLRSILVVGELAAAVVLVIGAALMVRGFQSLVGAAAYLQPDRVLAIRVSLNQVRYGTPAQRAAFFREAVNRAGALPGVRASFTVSAMPFSRTLDGAPFVVENRQMKPDTVQIRAVSAGYFGAMQVPLLAGSLNLDAPHTAVISESAAKHWSVSAGQRIQMNPPDGPWFTIAGIVGDVQQTALGREPMATVYYSYEQLPRREMDIVVRTSGAATALASSLRAVVRGLDPEQVITYVESMTEMIHDEAFVFAYMAALMGIFGLIAMSLSAIGIYGVMAYVVAQQQHEIGVRMALGAPRGAVMRMLLSRGMRTAAIGMAIGVVPAYALARLMRAAVFGVNLRDPAVFLALPLGLLAVALLAIFLPARRGTKVDPILALRNE